MSSELAISANGLGKAYHIYKKPIHRLLQMICRGRRQFFDEYWALKNVSLHVKRGETIGVIGRNGSGKSTLLQMIAGTLEPTVGSLTVNGRIAALLELGAGFNPEFSGRENVFLAASVLGLSQQTINERFESIADFAAIGDFIEQPVKTYSSGMFARLAFAVAAHVDADILIIDEILAVGDAAFTQKCMRFIHNFKKIGTILFVSHDTTSVTTLCDRAIWLECGEIREAGITKDVCHHYLTAINQEQERSSSFHIGGSRKAAPVSDQLIIDHRQELLRNSTLRNDLEVFSFDPNAPWFGERGATIKGVTLSDFSGSDLPLLQGGERVVLKITAVAERDIEKPIIGFYIKDQRGQFLFGDNTYLTYRDNTLKVHKGESFSASFHFQMPYLANGDHVILASVAEGTQAQHVQHHWIDDALFFRVHSTHLQRGLIGVPMLSITLESDSSLAEVKDQSNVSALG